MGENKPEVSTHDDGVPSQFYVLYVLGNLLLSNLNMYSECYSTDNNNIPLNDGSFGLAISPQCLCGRDP